ncbi:hypothetical protein MF271_16815 [Deinococcus sp. KNUC1210]|uniref:hypothetical protein n=1 Tax=Deinococcus sp. KNUC1210 TaxID=2917691 RepID=UPI001EF08FEA|nr:hypothetical protein [Deinococcus sp. KNUC1210]ULH15549.1 hypothetical protein MF271_16815 [Deinococcus sp. KNUC1210]
MDNYRWGPLSVVVSPQHQDHDGSFWRLVSTSAIMEQRFPTFLEVARVRDQFFAPEAEVIIRMHPGLGWQPGRSNCLYLWEALEPEQVKLQN